MAPRSFDSALGFGEALIAVPLLAFVLPIKVAVPIAALGRAINRRFDARRFFVYVHAGLAASGAGLVLQAILK